jgi:Ca2+-binding RTX toxin-like protein
MRLTAPAVLIELAGSTAKTVFLGAERNLADDTIKNFEDITTGSGADIAYGDNAANSLSAGDGNDVLEGRGGNDVLSGCAGSDVLTGGEGADMFLFGGDTFRASGIALLNLGEIGVDEIKDFDLTADAIQLDHDTFKAWAGPMADPTFESFGSGTDISQIGADDLLFYDLDDGNLYYDADGSGTASASLLFPSSALMSA